MIVVSIQDGTFVNILIIRLRLLRNVRVPSNKSALATYKPINIRIITKINPPTHYPLSSILHL